MSGTVHTGVEVHRMDSEMSRLVERPWLQLMCCAICLPHGCNFKWRRESPSGSEYWLVCCRWTLEIKFNKGLSSSIIRLVNYSVTTSLIVICKSTCPENYIPAVMLPLDHTSPPSMAATFLATCLMAVLQPSGYSVFHGGDTPIQLGLPWQSYFCQCLNTETSAWGNRGFTTETPSISHTICFVYKTSSYTVIH